jgi:hypothetical protein
LWANDVRAAGAFADAGVRFFRGWTFVPPPAVCQFFGHGFFDPQTGPDVQLDSQSRGG